MGQILIGSTGYITTVFIQDSTSTTGAGKPALVFNTSGLTCYYKRSNGTASVAVTLATISTLGTWATGGFKEIDATNMPGLYEFDPPDAALASGATGVTFFFQGATGMAPVALQIDLAAAAAVNVTQWNGTNVAAPNVAGVPLVDVGYIKGTASAGTAGYMGLDWGHINAPTSAVNLSATTIGILTTNNDKANYTLSGSGLDNVVIETGCNARQALAVIGAACGGLSSGVDVGSPIYKGLGVATTRIAATASSGNRSVVTLTLP